MKIAFLLLMFALGAMWYRGDLASVVEQRPEHLGLPSLEQIPSLPQIAMPEPRDLGKVIHEESRSAKTQEFIVQYETVKPMSIDEAAKKGDIKAWVASHEVKQEKNEIDKLFNFLARGKYE